MKRNCLIFLIIFHIILIASKCHSQEFEMPGFVRSIASCDMDLDGSNDIIVSCPYQDTIAILYNNGYGSFNIKYYNRLSGDIICGDFDGDEIPDIITGREGYLYFIKNNGNGSLEGNTIIMVLSGAYTLYQLVDMNNDNWNDIVYDFPDYWGIYKNNGDLTLSDEIIGSGNENKPEPYIGYLNNDLLPDILISYSYDYSEVTNYQINNNDFNFSTYGLNEMAFTQVISELNNEFPEDLILFRNPTPQVYLYENTGEANFVLKAIHSTLNTYGVIFANANDYNQDGFDDFSYTQCNWVDCTDSLYIELNDQNWSYEPAQQYYIGPLISFKAYAIDLNNDYYPDFYMTGYSTDTKIKILWNNGDGTFSYENPVLIAESPNRPTLSISACPNPFSDQIKIEIDTDQSFDLQVMVYDIYGRKVKGWSPVSNLTWNGHDNSGQPCPNGLYLIVAEGDNRRTFTKVVKY